MSENCNHQCASCSKDCSSRQEPESFLIQAHPKSKIKKIIGVVSGKGGVGKSMTSGLLATYLQRQGLRCGILDADITGPSIEKMFGIEEKAMGNDEGIFPNLSSTGIQIISCNAMMEDIEQPVIWRGPMIAGLVKQFYSDVIWTNIDVLIVDMPPGTGDVPLTIFQSLPVDGIVMVTSPQQLVSMIVTKAVNMAKMMNVEILGVVENMAYFVCPDCGRKEEIFGPSHLDEVAEKFNLDVLAKMPIDPSIARLADEGRIEDVDITHFDEAIKTICAKLGL